MDILSNNIFDCRNKPKVPFGLKDQHEMNMRVGISQDSVPVRVVDRVNGVFTCTICDVVILDRSEILYRDSRYFIALKFPYKTTINTIISTLFSWYEPSLEGYPKTFTLRA